VADDQQGPTTSFSATPWFPVFGLISETRLRGPSLDSMDSDSEMSSWLPSEGNQSDPIISAVFGEGTRELNPRPIFFTREWR
jgi:hypothetical protein